MVSARPKIGGSAGQTSWRFDGRNPAAQAFAQRAAARYVTQVSEETRDAIQTLIRRSIQDGMNARDTAKLIKSTVGLTSQSTAAVRSYYNGLLERGESAEKAWKLADKYSDKLLTVRAKTIARTEIMGALNGGALEQARQRAEAGVFKKPMKKWMITQDEVTCPVCRPMEGQIRPLMSPFSVGVMAPPAHPNCRCAPTFYDAQPFTAPEGIPATLTMSGTSSATQDETPEERRERARQIRLSRESK